MTRALDRANIQVGDAPLSHRNLIINGAMQVAQRGTSLSFAHDGTESGYTLDRFKFECDFFETFDGTVTQNSDAPSGFSSSLKWTTGTSEVGVASNEYARFTYTIEAQDLLRLDYGTSNAKTVTFSFYVKSSQTGTFSLSIEKNDTTARIFNSEYTISTADTWEYKTITVAGDTDSGASIVNDNGVGWVIRWSLASGSTLDTGSVSESWSDYADNKLHALPSGNEPSNDVVTTDGATWQITGVQLELGSVATPFEHRSFGEELQRCQRYYERYDGKVYFFDVNDPAVAQSLHMSFRTTKRAAPTITLGTENNLDTFYARTDHDQLQGVCITGSHSGTSQGTISSPAWIAEAEL